MIFATVTSSQTLDAANTANTCFKFVYYNERSDIKQVLQDMFK